MKSKEEIEKLAEQQYSDMFRETGFETFDVQRKMHIKLMVNFYNQCQEDMKIEWQLCPMCIGEGVVQNVGISSSIHRSCPVCNGNKTLIKPII